MPLLRFEFFGQRAAVVCDSQETGALLETAYGAFARDGGPTDDEPDLAYAIARDSDGGFLVRRGDGQPLHAAEDGWLLFELEKDLTIELQKRRRDLYFLHAAALERDGRALLLAAESGGGKSTTAWALLHHGFRYASDELAPVDLGTGRVLGFPHALCLKADPPAPYRLPPATLRTSRSRHVAVEQLPAGLAACPLPIGAIVFVRYRPDLGAPVLRPMGPAEAAARLYTQALNALAHPEDGLDAALQIVRGARCFALETTPALDRSCELLVRALFA